MKATVNNILILLLIGLLAQCDFSRDTQMGPIDVSYSLVRSFVTKDSVLFYSCIDSDSVAGFFNTKRDVDHKIKIDQLHIVLFYYFAPWIIEPQALENLRADAFPFSTFEVKVLEKDERTIKAVLKWSKNDVDSAASLIVHLYEPKPGVWKAKKMEIPLE